MPNNSANIISENTNWLEDQWTNTPPLQVISKVDEVPHGDFDPSTVLCTLEGILSDYSESTANDRWYSGRLWDNVFSSQPYLDAVRTRTLFGESDHPMDVEDRLDVHYNYVSHAIRDVEHDKVNKQVTGKVDILDTPAGRILYTFIRYGSILGVSSRGSGSLITVDGRTEVDPDTYQFYTWDIVHRPSNRRARLLKTNESVSKEYKDSNQRILSLVESAKSDKSTLQWIRKLTESCDISNKKDVLTKIDEYVDMLSGDDNDNNSFDKSQVEILTDALSTALDKINELESKLDELNINQVQSIAELDTTNDSDIIDTLESIKSKIESVDRNVSMIKPVKPLTDEIIDSSELVLDRVDEVYSKLATPLVKISESIDPYINSEFTLGAVQSVVTKVITDKLLNQLSDKMIKSMKSLQPQVNIPDDYLDELRKASKLESDYKILVKESEDYKIKSESDLSRISQNYVELMERYISTRCSQLGLNGSILRSRLNESLEDVSVDDVESVIEDNYSSSVQTTKHNNLNESDARLGSAKVVIQKSRNLYESKFSKSNDKEYDDALNLIRNNI